METAFPLWVHMANVEHLVMQGSTNANAPQPWLIDVMGARILGFEEPPHGKQFDGALLKLLRGNGVVTGRALYKNNVSYVPSYTLWFAANSPIEIVPPDQAVLSSIHSFEMPCYFKDEGCSAPLGAPYTAKKIPNIEERFAQRAYKMALFGVLVDYYERYRRDGLPPLTSKFSKRLTDAYHEEHPSTEQLFRRCFTVGDSNSALSLKRIFAIMQSDGYDGTQKKLRLFMEEKAEREASVKMTRPKNVLTFSGLTAVSTDQFY